MSKSELKEKKQSIQEALSKYETAFAVAKSEGNHRAMESAKKMIQFFQNQLKSLKSQ